MKNLPEPNAHWAVFLDVDGTLIEIADHPDHTSPSPRLPLILQRLAIALEGATALVSGRSIAAVDRLIGHTGLAVAGLHGLEMRAANGERLRTVAESHAMASARDRLQALVESCPGLYLEDKTATFAVHYRGAPAAADDVTRICAAVVQASDGQLELLHGKSVCELKPVGADKGAAVRYFMENRPFADRHPVYIGDDITDEHAFAAVNRMGGISIHVGNNVESVAMHSLASVDEVLILLQEIAENAGSQENHGLNSGLPR